MKKEILLDVMLLGDERPLETRCYASLNVVSGQATLVVFYEETDCDIVGKLTAKQKRKCLALCK